MRPDAIREVADRSIAAFNAGGDRDGYFTALYEDDVVLHGYTPAPLEGIGAVRGFYDAIFAAFPDCRVATEQLLVDGDHLAWRFRFAGTHTGPFMSIPPSGLPFDVPGITILRFGDARCAERWSVADFLTLMMQIGAVPPPDPSP
jgi:predicted ester cyclase